ncbi:c-type cytochrome [uncultured Zhongshania sp.]|uniref:c-type cytochrome n=1 Tax=uncultured Zhongshania sp. TaxID=1642288 RepID=UPI0030D8EF5B|tara:strand:+ start:822 stop:1508 length:687 start_codon:yes stop_codon:yes gene_type:complete
MKHRNLGMSRLSLMGLIVLAVLVGGGALLGPELLGYYRFSQAVVAMSEADIERGGAWPQLHQACMSCHGNQGDSINQLYPDLAGQPAAYIVEQMQAFASGTRANPNMSPLAATLSKDEIEQLAAYFATQPVVANSSLQANPALRDAGKDLVKQGGCIACHGPNFAGQGSFPRLAGQGFDYLVNQLQAYRDGRRADPSGTMPTITAALSDTDIDAIAQYLASHPVQIQE